MIKATPENVFVGSVIVKKKEQYNVFKVNKNFVWAGKHSSNMVMREIEFKEKGVTFAAIMEKVEAKKFNYNNLMLDESNIENVVEKKNPASKKEINKKDKYTSACCIKELKKMYEKFHAKKTYRYPVECSCGKQLFALQGYEDDTMAFRSEYTQLLFNYDTKEVTLIKDIAAVS